MEKKRARVKTSVSLDARNHEVVRTYLEAQGLRISGWLSNIFDEMAKQIEGQPGPWNKPVGKMTLDEFAEVMGYWRKAVSDEETKDDA
jgi:hypothetical protein